MAVIASTLQGLLVSKMNTLNNQWKLTNYDSNQVPDYLGEMASVISDYVSNNLQIQFEFAGVNASYQPLIKVDVLGITPVTITFTKSRLTTASGNRAHFTSEFKAGFKLGTISNSVNWTWTTPLPFATDVNYIDGISLDFGNSNNYQANLLTLSQSICDSITRMCTLTFSGTYNIGTYTGTATIMRML